MPEPLRSASETFLSFRLRKPPYGDPSDLLRVPEGLPLVHLYNSTQISFCQQLFLTFSEIISYICHLVFLCKKAKGLSQKHGKALKSADAEQVRRAVQQRRQNGEQSAGQKPVPHGVQEKNAEDAVPAVRPAPRISKMYPTFPIPSFRIFHPIPSYINIDFVLNQ